MLQLSDVIKKLYENDAEEIKDARKYEELSKELLKMGFPEEADIVNDVAKDERKHNRWLTQVRQSIAKKGIVKVLNP